MSTEQLPFLNHCEFLTAFETTTKKFKIEICETDLFASIFIHFYNSHKTKVQGFLLFSAFSLALIIPHFDRKVTSFATFSFVQ